MAKAVSSLLGIEDILSRYQHVAQLQEEVRSHVEAIHSLFSEIARSVGGSGSGRRGPGRPPKKAGAPARGRRPGGKRKRAKRGALKAAIHSVLGGGKVLRPNQIVKVLPKHGYRGSPDSKIFYNTVYLALRKDKNIEKTVEGFRLKASAKK